MAKGKSKGSAFERQVAKDLSLWWTKGERDDIFWRSQTSGARATQRKKQGKSTANQDGDLTAMDVIGQPLISKLSIELKCGYPAFNLEGVVNRPRAKKTVLREFLEQCKREVEGTDRLWWLIVKQNLKEVILIFPISFNTFLREKNCLKWKRLPHLTLKFEEWEITVVRFHEFLQVINPEIFIEDRDEA